MKPIAPKGMKCPLFKKDVSKVCHTCEWYDVLHGINAAGDRVEVWKCAVQRLTITMQDVGAINAQTCASVDRMRHEHSQARIVMTALSHRPPPQPAGGVTELLSNNETLRITDNRPAD